MKSKIKKLGIIPTERVETIAKDFIMSALLELSPKRNQGRRDEALEWFNDRSQEVFGYGWCLTQTHANPNRLRQLIGANLDGSFRGVTKRKK